ncbi:MAG: nodulation protein NfeD [Rhizobiales bacterium]|nr:nodulation protein NfeD [Hyphomicrobiales bacterium]
MTHMSRTGRLPQWPRRLWLPLLAAAALAFHAGSAAQEPSPRPGAAVLLDVEGAIGPATTDYLRQGFDAAVKRDAAVIILRMDTPGGLDSAMRDIIRDVLASRIPVITYVSPSGARAASAGTYILYASHLAAMAPGTNLGAATPVQIGGGGFPGGGKGDDKDKKSDDKKEPADASSRKAVNDAVAYIRGLADLRGRNADWAEKAVREAASLPANEALANRVIEIIATDERDLLNKADGRIIRIGEEQHTLKTTALQIVKIEPNWRVQILAAITNPNIAYILLLLGIYGLIFEFLNPGAVVPGVVGGIALLIGLYALNLMPINFAGAALMLLGVALMVAEAFLPSFGIVGIGGIVAFAIGSLLMFDTDVPGFSLSWPAVAAGTAVTAAFFLIAVEAAWRAHRRVVVTGEPALVGTSARVVRWDGKQGLVHVHGEDWQARADAPLGAGQSVRVVARQNLTLIVEPEAQTPPQPRG